MKILYFDCFSGISGDMTLAALTDLGVPEAYLQDMLATLNLPGWHLSFSRVKKQGIEAAHADVMLDVGEAHTHSHPHMDGGHPHRHDHPHSHGHSHEHSDGHVHEHSHEEHRGLADILAIIDGSGITPGAKALAAKAFRLLAEAEAKVHGAQIEDVHFHEAGAADSIIDMVGAAVCLDYLSFDRVLSSPLREGRGHIHCQHGIMPVPAPATAELIRSMGAPLRLTEVDGEMITPTGAALLAACSAAFVSAVPEAKILAIGQGAGSKDFPHANILRVMLLETTANTASDTVSIIETNLDDCSPEILGYTMERLFAAGALDVFHTPVYMKKNRPGCLLTVICGNEKRAALSDIILRETGSLGLRYREQGRMILEREIVPFSCSLGPVHLKLAGGRPHVEYEEAKALAERHKIPITDVYAQILKEFSWF